MLPDTYKIEQRQVAQVPEDLPEPERAQRTLPHGTTVTGPDGNKFRLVHAHWRPVKTRTRTDS